METTIKDQVKNIFKTNAFETALELTRDLRGEYISENGVKSWNALVAYYKKANIQPDKTQVAEPGEKYSVASLMNQFEEEKKKHPDAILLFRVGDFYEMFGKDAIEASEVLGITLTRRMNGKADPIELAGFPHHSLDTYLPKLVREGKRVAICEQLENQNQLEVKEMISPKTDEVKGLFDEVSNVEDSKSKENVQNQEEVKDEEKVEYMLYRNTGDKVEWFGHRENFYGLNVGDTARMIRMNNKGVSEGLVVASNALTLTQVDLFHRCYGVIIRMKISYKEQLQMASDCLNKLPEATKGLENLPKNDIKLTDLILKFGK